MLSNKLNKIYYSLFRIVFMRLSTSFLMFFIALQFDEDSLAMAAIVLLAYNLFELLSDNGMYESYVRNYSVVLRVSYLSLLNFIFVFSSVAVLIFSFYYGYAYITFLPIFYFFSKNIYFLAYLKYRGFLDIITKCYLYSNICMIVFFLLVQFLLKNHLVLLFSFFVQQFVLYLLLRRKRRRIIISFKLTAITLAVKSAGLSFLFKLSAFVSSRFIEVFIVLWYGAFFLSAYVAGSRVYNIICLVFFTVTNEVFLKDFNQKLGGKNKFNKNFSGLMLYYSLFFSPIFFILAHYSDTVVDVFFGEKFHDASAIFRYFSILGAFQVVFVIVYQASVIKVSGKYSLISNGLYFLFVCLLFICLYFLRSSYAFVEMVQIFTMFQISYIFVYTFIFCYRFSLFRQVVACLIVLSVYSTIYMVTR